MFSKLVSNFSWCSPNEYSSKKCLKDYLSCSLDFSYYEIPLLLNGESSENKDYVLYFFKWTTIDGTLLSKLRCIIKISELINIVKLLAIVKVLFDNYP